MEKETNTPDEQDFRPIPHIDIIDLETEQSAEAQSEPEVVPFSEAISEGGDTEVIPQNKFHFNVHLCLLGGFLLLVVIVLIRFATWGDRIDLSELFSDEQPQQVQNMDIWDSYIPLINDEGDVIPLQKSDGLNIVLFGNSPFSDDRDSENGVASMLADKLDANVYNFSLAGSYLTAEQPIVDPNVQPWDALSLYWLVLESTDLEVDDYFADAIKLLGDAVPEGLSVQRELSSLDFSTVDVIVIMYDATDYLLGRNLDVNEGYMDIQVFSEVFAASLDILQSQHPNARIIVMSPTYAFSDQKDADGNYISSDIYIYNEKPLSVYAITQYMKCYERSVTFVDNIYGTFNEDNAKDYLTDNLHLNQDGRQKVVERLAHAITYFGIE